MNELSRTARRITFTLFLTQSLCSAGFIAAATVNAVVGAELGGKPWAGAPSGVFLLGSALAASAWGVLMDIIGRRNGIALGLVLGVVGAGLVILAVNQSILLLVLVGMALLGFAQSAVLLGRFAAAEVNPPEKRGSAISNVVLGGTVGAIFGPLLIGPMGNLSLRFGLAELAGAYLAGLVLFGIASVIISIGLRPDPREIGQQVSALYPSSAPEGEARPIGVILRQPAALIAVAAMVLGQVVMVAIMGITALHMKDNSHKLSEVSAVISAHTLGMYAFSIISGRLADQLSPAERARTQGRNDLLVGLASATSVFGSGLVYDATSYTFISLLAGVLALIPLIMVLTWMRRSRVPMGA